MGLRIVEHAARHPVDSLGCIQFAARGAFEQPVVRRRLRLELAGEAGGEIVAAEISKRITNLRSARSFIDWQKRPDFVRDLELTRATIVERVGQTRPDLALDLMWRFMALAEPVINRVDDGSGTVGHVFRAACDDIGTLAVKVKPDPHVLVERVLAAVTKNEYGEFDNLGQIRAMLKDGYKGTFTLETHWREPGKPKVYCSEQSLKGLLDVIAKV